MHRNMTERSILMFICSAVAPVHVCVTASFINLSLLFAFLIRHWECSCPLIYPLQSNASVQKTVASLCNRYLSPEGLVPFNRAENDDCFPFWPFYFRESTCYLCYVTCAICRGWLMAEPTKHFHSKCFMLFISQVRRASEVSLTNAVMCQKWKKK